MRAALIVALTAALIGAAAAQETKEPIKLGAIEVLTGPNNRYGIPAQRAFDLAVGEINKSGGVLGGRPIAIAYEDSAGNKDQAMNAARKLVGRDKVPLLLGPTLSNEMFAVGPVVTTERFRLSVRPRQRAALLRLVPGCSARQCRNPTSFPSRSRPRKTSSA